jgi:hypothetical protein
LGGDGGCPPRAGGAAEELVEVPGEVLARVTVDCEGVVGAVLGRVDVGRVVVGRVVVPVVVGRVLVPVEVVDVDVSVEVSVPVVLVSVPVVEVSVPVVLVSVPVVDVSVPVVVVSVAVAVVVSVGLLAARAAPAWALIANRAIAAVTVAASSRRRFRRVADQ